MKQVRKKMLMNRSSDERLRLKKFDFKIPLFVEIIKESRLSGNLVINIIFAQRENVQVNYRFDMYCNA